MANPLDRTWYNTLVDDDGSGNTGTVWNKGAVDALMDAVDASLAGVVDKSGSVKPAELALFTDGDTIQGGTAIIAAGGGTLVRDTPPGADNGVVTISGAGAVDVNRGANIYIAGNQYGAPGFISLSSGLGGAISLNRGNTPSVQLGADGSLNLLDGLIRFPVPQKPSIDPNTLDDYREGTWTPALIGSGGQSGQTYSFQDGRYVKVGRLVVIVGYVALNTAGTFSGNIHIAGLPFQVVLGGGVAFGYWANFVTPTTSMICQLAANATNAPLFYVPTTGTQNSFGYPVTQAQITGGTAFQFTAAYLAAA